MVATEWQSINIGIDTTLKARIGWQGLTVNEYRDNGNYYLVTGTDFDKGLVNWNTCHYVDKYRYTQDRNIQLRNGDILITKDGTIGKVGYVENLTLPATLNSGVFVVRPKHEEIFSKYLYYIFTSEIFDDFLTKLVAGSTINHLYQKDFVNFEFQIPPKQEQQAIATALSDTDALIHALEKLIAKKEAIKTGTMQELLTGKKRLDGFSGEWEEKKLGLECDVITKGTTPTSIGKNFTTSGINFVKVESLRKNGTFIKNMFAYIDEDTHNILARSKLQNKDLLISIAGALGRVGIVTEDILPANTNQALAIVRLKEKSSIDLSYLFYYLNTCEMRKHIEAMSSQGAQPNLSLENIYDLPIVFSQNIKEQQFIASILSCMDNELEALKTKLSKIKVLKEGMMQELLTGKTRLLEGINYVE